MADAVRDPLDSLLTIPEAAERAGLSGTTIRRRVDNGSLRHHKLGRLIFINEDELAEDSAKWNRTRSEDGHPFPGGYAHESVWAALVALYELEEPVTAAELAIAIDRDPGNVRKYLKILRIRGFVEKVVDAQYEITDDGRAFVAENREQYEGNENSESARNS